jgi:hypothetical protein
VRNANDMQLASCLKTSHVALRSSLCSIVAGPVVALQTNQVALLAVPDWTTPPAAGDAERGTYPQEQMLAYSARPAVPSNAAHTRRLLGYICRDGGELSGNPAMFRSAAPSCIKGIAPRTRSITLACRGALQCGAGVLSVYAKNFWCCITNDIHLGRRVLLCRQRGGPSCLSPGSSPAAVIQRELGTALARSCQRLR